jgi:TatD DNase family protein
VGRLVDTHCHLNLNIFQDDLAETLQRAWEAGLERILIPGIDIATSQTAVQLCEQHTNLYAAVGVHPGDASTWKKDSLSILRDLAAHPRVVAIGEIGLDYYRDRSPRQLQREVFRTQLDLAGELNLPVVLHNREALDDLWAELMRWQAQLASSGSPLATKPGVLHSYDGDLPSAQRAANHNFAIGISGPVTFKNAVARHQVAAGLTLDHLLIETDAPYLTPHPYRGRRNEPAYVARVAARLAELHQQPEEVIQRATWNNAVQLFHWGATI